MPNLKIFRTPNSVSFFTKRNHKKALVRLQQVDKESKEVKDLGFGFKAKKENKLIVVTSSSTLPEGIREDEIVVDRFRSKSRNKKYKTKPQDQVTVESIHMPKQHGIRYLSGTGGNEKEFFCMDYKDEIRERTLSAFAFEDKKIVELQFENKQGTWHFTWKSNKDFDVKKAKGAPIIRKDRADGSVTVIGVLSINSSGQPYPVLFTKDFYVPRPPSDEPNQASDQHSEKPNMASGMSSSSPPPPPPSAAAAAPSSLSSSSQKKSNFARLCWLLIDTATHVVREVFDNIHKPTSLHAVLHSTSVHNTLRQLKSRRILNTQQWYKLYPSRSTSVSSASFDITLLFALLRNICNLTPPPTGWDQPPAASDLSKEADLVRIKWYRNEVYAHRTETTVSDADFEKLWTEISAVLIRLGGPHYKPDIDRIKEEPMDSNDEKYYIKMLEEWKQLGDELLQKMDEVLKVLKGGKPVVAASASEAEEYTRKLKSSIKRQTESLPVLEGQTAVTIDDVFTNVTIQRVEKDQEKTKLGKKQFDVFQASSTTLKKCSEMFIWPENDDPNSRSPITANPKFILLTGKPGIGKSEFCRKMSRDWAKDGILDFKFLFLLTYRQLSLLCYEELDLCDILNRSSLLDEQSMIDKGLLQYMIENPEKVLIIFDGYDEYGYRTEITGDFETKYPNNPHEKMPVPAMIAKIMKGKILKDSVAMISSRPQEAQELKIFPFDVKCEIHGFSPLQVQEYIQKYFKG